MSRIYRCDEDECVNEVALPIMVLYTPADDELDDPDGDADEAHFCSWTCLAQWSTREAVEQACDAPPVD